MAGPQCCSNPPDLSSSSGAGFVEEIGSLKCYITGSADSKTAVLFASDIFGYEAPKLRKLADKVAGLGFFVVVPDFHQGDYVDWGVTDLQEWLKIHTPEQGFEHAKPIIEALKDKGIAKVGAVGFCWGAKVAVELAKHPYIDAAVMIHPSFVTVEDVQAVKVPISILGAEIDHMCPKELVKTFEEVLTTKPEVDSFVKIFPGVAHGWAVRYKDEDENEVKLALEAHQDMMNWCVKYLK
ncbi:OLC1v1020214C1 [Oldenlandia corymbosa var. corymbosa]|uniref:OLC1v1020214C1 n=1 Tax=Oldenlandia corymbosa var. corymbosa TaxID=529605 RepID=A0AAV1EGB8_OLDCO|nr:OLC1v1020214C1 [Oldenlandia corymbosa var. corymbosa]